TMVVDVAEVCVEDTEPVITFTGSGGTARYTFTYEDPDGNTQTVTSDNSGVATIEVPTDVDGSFTYELIAVQDDTNTHCEQAQSGSVTIQVNPLPEATMVVDVAEVCVEDTEPIITF